MKALLAALAIFVATPAQAKIDIIVHHQDLRAEVFQDGELIRTYPIAMGKPGTYVPVGTHRIRQLDFNPSWRGTRGQGFVSSGPRSPLGRVRMRFDGNYALHGTIDPNSIGSYASLGCIRLLNSDVIELSEIILKDTGSWQGQSWFNNMLTQPRRMFHVPLRESVTITINGPVVQ